MCIPQLLTVTGEGARGRGINSLALACPLASLGWSEKALGGTGRCQQVRSCKMHTQHASRVQVEPWRHLLAPLFPVLQPPGLKEITTALSQYSFLKTELVLWQLSQQRDAEEMKYSFGPVCCLIS